MTLEEGIIHAEDVAKMNHEAAKHLTDEHPTQAEKCEECAREHEQLAEWLKELKEYKEQSGDAISRQAVIDRINKQREGLEPEIYPQDKIGNRAYRICIEFIKNDLPSVTPQPCEDAISRKEAYAVVDHMLMGDRNHKIIALDEIQKLPPVTPQPRMGRWIQKEEAGEAEPFIIWECSECHGYQRKQTAYCPDCGSKMEVE